MVYRYPGRRQHRLRLGERRRDHRSPPRMQVAQQRETFRCPGQQHDLIAAAAMPGSDGISCGGLVVAAGVASQIRQAGGEPLHQPRRRLVAADIDGEIQHARPGRLIAVVARRRRPAGVQTHHRFKQ
jgi:hypothetical protein